MALTATLCGPTANAEEWISLYKTSDNHPSEIFLDLSSITVKTNIRIATTKGVPLLPRTDGTRPFNGAAFGIQRVSFNCKSALVKLGGMELHNADGTLGWLDLVPMWRPTEAEPTEKMLELVCAAKLTLP